MGSNLKAFVARPPPPILLHRNTRCNVSSITTTSSLVASEYPLQRLSHLTVHQISRSFPVSTPWVSQVHSFLTFCMAVPHTVISSQSISANKGVFIRLLKGKCVPQWQTYILLAELFQACCHSSFRNSATLQSSEAIRFDVSTAGKVVAEFCLDEFYPTRSFFYIPSLRTIVLDAPDCGGIYPCR